MPTRESLVEAFHGSAEGLGLSMVYDVAHNLPKIEEYEVDGRVRKLCAVTVSQPELLAEEASYAYKDVSQVVRACEGAAPSRTAAGPHPVEVVKG